MNKYCFLFFVFSFCSLFVNAEKCGFSNSTLYNFTVPHINKGTLTKIDYSTAIKTLKLSSSEALSFEKEYIHKSSGMRYSKMLPNGENELIYRTPQIISLAAYKQYIAKDGITLYRLIFEYKFSHLKKMGSTTRQIYQKVYQYFPKTGKSMLLFADFYHTTLSEASKSNLEYCKNVMPIIKNKQLCGIVIYGIEKYTEEILNDIDVKRINHQTHFADIYWINEYSQPKIYDIQNEVEFGSNIHIEASWPLINNKDIFNYTIQNAIDNNPKTCFEENTPDNLIDINIDFKKETDVMKIALINGQAESKESYFNNNQITEFGTGYNHNYWNPNFQQTTTLQIHPFEKNVIKLCTGALSLKKGRRYNDSCISEFNVYVKDINWLFYNIQ